MRSQDSQYCCRVSGCLSLLVLSLVFIALLSSCGGGSSSAPPTQTPAVSVTISEPSVTLATAETHTFAATVSNANNTGLNWSVQEGASGGTIMTTGAYTAPTTAGTYHVVATSQQDRTKSATATVTVRAVGVTITPDAPTVPASSTQAFTASVTNTSNSAVSWKVQESTGGAISDAGLYKAPILAGTYHVIATSKADSTKSATTIVTVSSTPPAFTSTPPTDANEGDPYAYTVHAQNIDNPDGTVSLTLTDAPDGATLDGNVLTWTPTRAQSRKPNDFTITATTSENKQNTQIWSVSPTGTIHIVYNSIYESLDGTETVPESLVDAPWRLLAKDSNGQWKEFPGTGTPNGTFDVPGVPAGYYFILFTGGYLSSWTDQSDVDASFPMAGRRDKQSTANTTRHYTLTGLDAWDQIFGTIQWQVVNTYDFTSWSGTVLAAGDTTFDKQLPAVMLADASKGDIAIANQFAGNSFRHIVKSTGPLSITDTAGSTTVVNASMTAPTNSVEFGAKFTGSEFAQLLPPNASFGGATLEGHVYPYADSSTVIVDSSLPDLFTFNTTTDIDLGSLSAGNPFPETWKPIYTFRYGFRNVLTAPGATPSVFYGSSWQTRDVAQTEENPFLPVLGPITTGTVDGKSLFADQSGISLAPTLRWNPSALGTADGYSLTLMKLAPANNVPGSYTNFLYVTTTSTTATELTFPEGILEPDSAYVVVIGAISAPGANLYKAPYMHLLTYAEARSLSGMFTTVAAPPANGAAKTLFKQSTEPLPARPLPTPLGLPRSQGPTN